MIPEHYPYNVGFEWDPPYRFLRIRSVIESAKKTHNKLTMASMESLQNDVTSLPALELQKLLSTTSIKDDPTLRGFLNWNGKLAAESSEAALYEVWFQQICRALGKCFSKEHPERYADLSPVVVLRILTTPPTDLFGDNPPASRDEMLADTLQSARKQLTQFLGPDSAQWSWGKLHTANFRHALDQKPGAKDLLDLGPLARPGDEYTVNATGAEGDSWEQVSGASYREILDTGNWDQSVAVNTPGQSGQPGSPHYSDLMPLWDAGRYFPLLYSRKAVESETSDRLVLEP